MIQVSPKPPFWQQAVRWFIGVGLAVLAFVLLARDLDWPAVGEALRGADYRWVILGVLAIVGTMFSRAWRWRALLALPQLSLREVFTALLLGQTLNMLLPARAGDVARAVWVGRIHHGTTAQALGSIAIEKIWDLLALLLCTLLLLAWMPLPDWFLPPTWIAAATFLLCMVVLWAALRWRERWLNLSGRLLAHLPRRWGWDRPLLRWLDRLADGLAVVRQPGVGAVTALGTAATWLLGAVVNGAVLAAFGIASPQAALLLLVVLMAGAAVPTPANLGIFEGICVLVLGAMGHSRDVAVAVGLVLHLVVIAPPLLATGLLLLFNTLRRGPDERD